MDGGDLASLFLQVLALLVYKKSRTTISDLQNASVAWQGEVHFPSPSD